MKTGVDAMLRAALACAARGWRVLPLHTPLPDGGCTCRRDCGRLAGKHPRIARWQHDATADEWTLRNWWDLWPDANIGIATGRDSGLIVIDLDPEKDGRESWNGVLAEFRDREEREPATVEAITGSLGTHLLFAHPGDLWLPNRQGWLPGVDVRGDGGYIVAPPSLHRSGRRYAWDLAAHPDDTPLTPLPAWLAERLVSVLPKEPPERRDEGGFPPAPAAPVLQGCGWLRHTLADAATLGYEPWYAMLSLAGRLEDGSRLAHAWSKPHPHYTPEETGRLLSYALAHAGPATCRFIRERAGGETYCRECIHWGRITSPLMLARGKVAALAELEPPEHHRMTASLLEDSPLAEESLYARNGSEAPPPPPPPPEPGAGRADAPLRLTDVGNAARLVRRHGEDLRYCPPWDAWLIWDGKRWGLDEVGQIVERAKETAAAIAGEAGSIQGAGKDADDLREAVRGWSRRSENITRITAMIRLAQSDPAVVVLPGDLDGDPWLLNCRNGTIDLRTAALLPHRRADLITKLCPADYDPEAPAPVWEAFLARVLPEETVRTFVRRSMGYTATALTGEEVIFLPYGSGRNGKSKFLAALEHTLGSYAKGTRPETFLAKKGDQIPNDVAALVGARFVPTREAEEGRRLDVALIKQMTGGDTMEARFLGKEFFRFKPLFKIWFAVNHKPVIRDTTESIWERVMLIPFTVFIPPDERDRELEEKLRAEAPGILAWLVRGCLQWHAQGLKPPAAVCAATRTYREEMDVLAGFITDCCALSPACKTTTAALYGAYQGWCETNGEHALASRVFGTKLSERGFEPTRGTGGARGWKGIGLRSDSDIK